MSFGLIGVTAAEQGRYTAFHASLSSMQKPEGTQVMYSTGAEVSVNRNRIVQIALEMGADWVLFVDDDQILRSDTLLRLLAAEKDVISALYVQRRPPFNPVLMSAELPNGGFVWKQLHPAESGVIEVAAAGAGCLLVRKSVLQALEAPYWRLGQINPATWGDDLDFCRRVRAAGFSIYADLDAYIGHIMTGIVWPEHSKAGWTANFAIEPKAGPPLVRWPMQLPGDF